MKKRVLTLSSIFSVAVLILLLFLVQARRGSGSFTELGSEVGSIDAEIKKITNYAEEFETGNINYVQLLVYTSAVREKMNEVLGAIRYQGGILKGEQLKPILGEPTEEQKWVWVENEEREIKLDSPAPAWKKIIFDGKKIQIWLMAFPHIFSKKNEQILFYRLHLEINFKKPEKHIDIKGKIAEIKTLAERFNADPTKENAEVLAKESVNAEKIFNFYMKQNQGNCEDTMKSIFGAENIRETQKMLVQEIDFYEGENFEAIARLEMCDDCEWNWINLDIWIEGRGPGFEYPKEQKPEDFSPEKFEHMSLTDFENEMKKILGEIRQALEERNYELVFKLKPRIHRLNEAWNRKANDIWEDLKGADKKDMTEEEELELKELHQKREQQDPYYWIKKEQENRRKVKELRKKNYNRRKQFYLNLFSGYEKKEFYFTQIEYEKRLVEEFREFGEEICNNNKDDNNNEEVDCSDNQCRGKICGKQKVQVAVEEDNGQSNDTNKTIKTIEVVKDLYCIEGMCQLKEEEEEEEKAVCGNHVCEEGENIENCVEDCTACPEHPPINCSGRVIFKGEDENNCPLEPVCIEENETCMIDEDCAQPLCGIAECVKGECKVTELDECNQTQCVDGDKKMRDCPSGAQVVDAECVNGIWEHLDIACPEEKVCCKETGAADSVGHKWLDESECVGGDNTARDIVDNIYCEEEKTCEKYCAGVPHPTCLGDWEISGSYPDCSCRFICKEEEPRVGEECKVREDCGGENDVCSNGKCVPVPQVIRPGEESIEEIEKEVKEEIREIEEEFEEIEEREEEKEEEWREKGEEREEWKEEREEEKEEEWREEETKQGPERNELAPEPTIAGQVVNTIKSFTGRIVGFVITGFQTEGEDNDEEKPAPEPEPQPEPEPEPEPTPEPSPEPGPEPDEPGPEDKCMDVQCPEGTFCVSETGECKPVEEPIPPEEDWEERDEEERREKEKWGEKDRKRKIEEEKERCERNCEEHCYNRFVRHCVNKCIWEECGEELECDVDKIGKECEDDCKGNKEVGECESDCYNKCIKGEDWWEEEEPEEEKQKEEKGVFQAGGGCRTSKQQTESFIWFGGWGDPFEEIQNLKHKYYQGGEADWCKQDLENLLKQRKELERGLNQEFIEWFFEKYLANSAEDWEQHVSGIFELYWRDVDLSRQIVERMRCLGKKGLPEHNLINIKYKTEYGELEFWEEVKTVKMPGFREEVEIITPYMKIWIFPPKSFLAYEMKQSMKNHEFPGPPEEKLERKKQEGPTEEEKEIIRQNKKLMKKIRELSEKYGGNLDAVIQLKDFEKDEVVFNLYAQINEEDIIKIEPMLPEEVPEEDVRVEIDFEKVYDLILASEKDMKGAQIESPPWAREKFKPVKKIKETINGIKMYFKVRSIINSAKVYPKSAKGEVKDLFKTFFKMMMKGEGDRGDRGEEGEREEGEGEGEGKGKFMEEGVWEDKEVLTGEVIG